MAKQFVPPRIAQVGVQCGDLGEAREFYCDRIGLDFVAEIGDSIFVRCGESNLILQTMDEPTPSNTIYFSADGEIHTAVEDLQRRGVVFKQPPACIAEGLDTPDAGVCDVWLGFFDDPWGNEFGLIANMPVN